MIDVLEPLAAYTKDRVHAGRDAVTPCDAELLRLALVLQRYSQLGHEDEWLATKAHLRHDYVRLTQALRTALGKNVLRDIDHDAGAAQSVAVARDLAHFAEEYGAFRIAYAMLHFAEAAFGADAGALECGRVLAQRARVARLSGEGSAADVLYGLVREAAEALESPELHARAHFGFGMRARERGNLPLMQEHATAALVAAIAAQDIDLIASAHHGLTVVAGEQGRFDEAILHAWAGFRDVRGHHTQEAHALSNVAQAILDFGEPLIALHAFVAALARRLPMRLELPALGGAAIAAARVGDRLMLDRVVVRIDALAATGDLPFDALSAQAEVVTAMMLVRDDRAEPRRQDVLARSTAGKFHSIIYRMEHMGAGDEHVSSPGAMSSQLRHTLDEVEQASHWTELQFAF